MLYPASPSLSILSYPLPPSPPSFLPSSLTFRPPFLCSLRSSVLLPQSSDPRTINLVSLSRQSDNGTYQSNARSIFDDDDKPPTRPICRRLPSTHLSAQTENRENRRFRAAFLGQARCNRPKCASPLPLPPPSRSGSEVSCTHSHVDAGGFFAIDFKRAAYHVHPHTYNTRLRYMRDVGVHVASRRHAHTRKESRAAKSRCHRGCSLRAIVSAADPRIGHD